MSFQISKNKYDSYQLKTRLISQTRTFYNEKFEYKTKFMINVEVLLAHGATLKKYDAGDIIFSQGSTCKYYHQVVEGCIIWENLNDEGKRFIQYIVEPGESFGELPLFDGEGYAANAMAEVDSLVVRLPKEIFVEMLREDPDLHFSFSKLIRPK